MRTQVPELRAFRDLECDACITALYLMHMRAASTLRGAPWRTVTPYVRTLATMDCQNAVTMPSVS